MTGSKVVLITGASSGIGASAAKLFAKQGTSVAFTYHTNEKGAGATLQELKTLGVNALSLKADLKDEAQARRVVEEVLQTFGHIDILVNNAGRYIEGDEWNGSSGVWEESLSQNLISMMRVAKYVIPVFQKQQSGIMVNVASRHGMSGQYDAISYAAAKAGVINITEAYAKLLEPYGRANSVSPSATEAGYWLNAPEDELEETLEARPNHKLVNPETVAEKIIFLASDEAADINGQNFPVVE